MRVAVCILMLACVVPADSQLNIDYRQSGQEELQRALRVKTINNLAKNVIVMIGDGMGLSTITAARIYKGQKKGFPGEEYKLSFETFPFVGLSKTYNVDRQVSDSAGTATAIMTGVKVNLGTIGVTSDVPFAKSCDGYSEIFNLKSVLDYALEANKSVGFVTTARVTHATPASTYAHTPYRDWESDSDMAGVEGCEKVKDIAYQLVIDNPRIQVILGGGRRSFLNKTTPDPSTGRIHSQHRTDGLDLIEAWKNEKVARNVRHAYVENYGQFRSINPRKTDYLLGLFSSSHMTYELERDKSNAGEPSLTDMTRKAIDILEKNPNGYFLLIEGGRIDQAHHNNSAKKALEEAASFDDAVAPRRNPIRTFLHWPGGAALHARQLKNLANNVQAVLAKTNEKDTLLIVTADHSHVFSIAGYPSRGNNILGTVDRIDEGEGPTDGLPYLTLTYANGPEYGRKNLTGVDTTANDFRQPGCVPMLPDAETHGGEDVAIYANGPHAHLFHTTHEQSYIAHVVMYASCTGFYVDDCPRRRKEVRRR